MSILKGKKILIFQQRGWAKTIGRFLAKKLYQEGACLAAITFKKSVHPLIVNQPGVVYDLIISNDQVMENPKEFLAGDKISLAEVCRGLGVESIWPFVSTLRNFVRSYKDKYYYGFGQNVADEELITLAAAFYKYIKIIFDKFNPDVILTPNFVAMPHMMMNMFAAQKAVPMIAVIDSKVSGYSLFSQSFRADRGEFHNRVDALNQGLDKSSNQQRARQYIKDFREQFKKPTYADYFQKKTLARKIKDQLHPYLEILRWCRCKPSNVSKNTGITPDYRPPRIILRDHYCSQYYKKFMDNLDYFPLDKLKKFVYFPLQFQPEAIIDVISCHFSNQIETARQVAMSLPDDYTLVVKEHPNMIDKRPPSYIEKLIRATNIKLIDYRVPTAQVFKRTSLVVSPSSTTIAEAGFLRVPAIQLGNLGTTLKLPNVFKHTDITTLSAKIKQVLTADLTTPDYERRLENYVAAVYDAGFDFDYLGAYHQGKGDFEQLWQIYKNEIERVLSKPR